MKRLRLGFFFLLVATSAHGEAITLPHPNFAGGSIAVADEVDANFAAVEVGVDDNAADINALELLDHTDHGAGVNCAAGSYPLGVDANADSEFCTDATIEIDAAVALKQDLDADLTDLADGELTGSKVGAGISGDNITDGTIDETEIAPDSIGVSELDQAAAFALSGAWNSTTTGSVDFAGPVTATSFDADAHATNGSVMTLKEGADDGVNTIKFNVPNAGLAADRSCELQDDSTPFDNCVTPATIAGSAFSECFPLYAPSAEIQATDDIESVWRASAALTITEVWCETDVGTVTMDIQIDDGTPADVMGVDLVCAETAVSDSTALTGGMAAGDRLDFAITSVATAPKRLSLCIGYDYD